MLGRVWIRLGLNSVSPELGFSFRFSQIGLLRWVWSWFAFTQVGLGPDFIWNRLGLGGYWLPCYISGYVSCHNSSLSCLQTQNKLCYRPFMDKEPSLEMQFLEHHSTHRNILGRWPSAGFLQLKSAFENSRSKGSRLFGVYYAIRKIWFPLTVANKKTENRKNPWQKIVESMAKNLFPENVKNTENCTTSEEN